MLELLGAATRGFNDWRPVAMTPWPGWLLTAVGLLLLGALAYSWWGVRRLAPGRRWSLRVLRTLVTLLLFVLLLEPGVELLQAVHERGRLAVLLDASSSMQLRDGDRSRWERAGDRLAELTPVLQELGQQFDLEVYRFGAELHPVNDLAAALAGSPNEERTDLVQILSQLEPAPGQRPLGGVVIISDGADTSGLELENLERVRPVVNALRAPLLAVPAASAEQFRDLAIDRVVVDDFAFVRNRFEVDAVVRAHGIEGKEITATLSEKGRVVAMAPLVIDPAQSEHRVRFEVLPQQTGKRTFQVEIPLQANEAIAENNRHAFRVKVIRDRIRVLQVVGRPSWDERYLRRLLKANPSVDLISFFILRTQGDTIGHNDDLSLIPFPTDELFTTELRTFDVVIFQNFDYGPYNMAQYLDNVRDFVRDQGGGFAMVGGDLSFAEGGYGGTPVAEILPVRLPPVSVPPAPQAYQPVVTAAGRRHPILDLGAEPAPEMVARLPSFSSFNRSAGALPDALVLLEHPFERAGGTAAPVLAVREVGRGRTLAMLSPDSWFWSLPDVGSGGRGTVHRRLWANVLRWLIRDPELARVRIEIPQRRYSRGAAVEVTARALSTSYQPLAGATLEWSLSAEDGALPPLTHRARTDEEGGAVWRLPSRDPGSHRLTVKGKASDGTDLGWAEEVFVVSAADRERVMASPRPELLAALAHMSGGRVLTAAEPEQLRELVDQGAHRTRVHHAERMPLWDHGWSLLLLTVVAGCEWWLRRRWGFS